MIFAPLMMQYLAEQKICIYFFSKVEAINKVSKYVAQLRRVGKLHIKGYLAIFLMEIDHRIMILSDF